MDPTQVCCPNEVCSARGPGGKGNITVHRRKEARYRCTVCEKTFSARRGTMVSWKKTPVDIIVLVVTLLAHGCPVRALVAAFGVTAETVRTWAAEAGVHGAQVHRHLVLGACWSLRHGHADEMRVRVQQGMVWMAMALMVSPRLWLGGVVSAHRDKGLIRPLADRGRAGARHQAAHTAHHATSRVLRDHLADDDRCPGRQVRASGALPGHLAAHGAAEGMDRGCQSVHGHQQRPRPGAGPHPVAASRRMRPLSRWALTTPPNHSRVLTISAIAIHPIPFCTRTRISSACPCRKDQHAPRTR